MIKNGKDARLILNCAFFSVKKSVEKRLEVFRNYGNVCACTKAGAVR